MVTCLLMVFLVFATSEAKAQQSLSVADLIEQILSPEVEAKDLALYLSPLTARDIENLAVQTEKELQRLLLRTVELKTELADANPSRLETTRQQITDTTDEAYNLVRKYRKILNTWSNRGGKPESVLTHRRFLWAITSDLIRVTEFRVLATLLRDWMFSASGGIRALMKISLVAVSIAAILSAAALIRRLTSRRLERSAATSILLRSFLSGFAYWLALLVGLVVMLSFSGVRVSPLLAIFGGVSFILGLALQDSIGNVASGLMIMINRSFDVGHYIQAGGEAGFVETMSLVSTKIRTVDNKIIQIPNSKIWSNVIVNSSASKTRRVDLVFGISYSTDTGRAIQILERLVKENQRCLKEPKVEVFVGELGESSVSIYCRPWVVTADYWTVYWELTAAAKDAFDAAGIELPFPQVEVRIRSP